MHPKKENAKIYGYINANKIKIVCSDTNIKYLNMQEL